MSTAAPSQRKVDATDVNRILNVVRNTGMPAAEPVIRSISSQPATPAGPARASSREPSRAEARDDARDGVAQADPVPADPARPRGEVAAKPRRAKVAGMLAEKPFEVAAGQGTTALTVRVSNDLHARLKLMVTRNQIARNGDPRTINAIVTQLIERGIDLQDAA